MTIRTTSKTITFPRPFSLGDLDAPQPAGTYVVETDEERIEGLSLLAYRRVGVRIHLPPSAQRPGITETITVDPAVLDAALAEGDKS